MAAAEGEAPDLAAAAALAAWSARPQSEHPGRFVLIDSDGSEASEQALEQRLPPTAARAELALREGGAAGAAPGRRPRRQGEPARPLDPERTVLITGGHRRPRRA